jgi:hypothetical protein
MGDVRSFEKQNEERKAEAHECGNEQSGGGESTSWTSLAT